MNRQRRACRRTTGIRTVVMFGDLFGESSVILQGPYDAETHTMKDFYEGLEKVLEEKVIGTILALGPLTKSNEYHLAVNNRSIRNKLIMCGSIFVKEQTTDSTRFNASVH